MEWAVGILLLFVDNNRQSDVRTGPFHHHLSFQIVIMEWGRWGQRRSRRQNSSTTVAMTDSRLTSKKSYSQFGDNSMLKLLRKSNWMTWSSGALYILRTKRKTCIFYKQKRCENVCVCVCASASASASICVCVARVWCKSLKCQQETLWLSSLLFSINQSALLRHGIL